MNFYLLLYWITILKLKASNCIKLNISSKESAFIKHSSKLDSHEIIYKQPLEDKLMISAFLGDLKSTKELERSKYKSSVYTDKQILSTQSNLNRESFTINSICKFDHDKLAAFALDKACCEITLKSPANHDKILDRKFCKLEISDTSSACYVQSEVGKEHFDFRKRDEFELEINSRVFSSQDSKCHEASAVVDNLALGFPTKLIVTQGLQVKWEQSDVTDSFGELEIGIPVDSIDISSKTIFPLKIRSPTTFSNIVLTCSFGEDLSLSSISFESTKFDGEFKKSSDNLVKILLMNKDNMVDIGGDSTGEQLVNLRVRRLNSQMYIPNQTRKPESWISCRVEKALVQKTKVAIQRKSDSKTNRIFVKVNEDNFIIIPLVQKSYFFSILNPIFGPIELGSKHWKVFNVHNTRDGSLIDVTSKTQCKPISNSTLKCPFDNQVSLVKEPIKNPNWNVILTMMSWRKMVNIPIDFWQAEDWQIVTSDKKLNRIANWNYPIRLSDSCKPVFQSARCQLFARLVKETVNGDKIYFGHSVSDPYPLLDMTPQLSIGNVLLSNNNIDATLNNNMIFLLANSIGSTDVSIVDNLRNKVAFELMKVDEETVFVDDLEVSCIHTLDINHSSVSDDPSFRSIIIDSKRSKHPNESCYFKITLIFSDRTRADLLEYRHTNFLLDLVHPEGRLIIRNLDKFLFEPSKYKDPGKFILHLYESDQCSKKKLIIKKSIDIYEMKTPKIQTQSIPSTVVKQSSKSTTTSSLIVSASNGSNSSEVTSKGGIDTGTLFLTMKILIGLVVMVMLIFILNCIIKFRNRKSASLLDRQLNTCQIYGQMDKLTTSTYSPPDMTNQNSNQHPPLLPPPGPLYNSSDSSQLDLAVNATPDIFWGLPHSGDNIERSMPSNHHLMAMKMNTLNGQCNTVGFPNIFSSSRRTSPSPHSDNVDYNYHGSNGTKSSHARTKQSSQNGYHYPPSSLHDSDSLASGSGSKTSSQIAVIVPPCPPLRWNNNNWNTSQFPVYFSSDKDQSIEPSISRLSTERSSQNSLTPSHSSSWEVKQPLVLPPVGFNSIDNVCEKSSGLGSLTSTQPGSDCSKKEIGHIDSPKTTTYSTSH